MPHKNNFSHKKMRTTILALCCLVSAIAGQAQINLKDSTVNVVAYFHKNDTLTYNYTHYKLNYDSKDTLFDSYIGTEFRLVVLDETDKGYRIEYTPIAEYYAPDSQLSDKGKMLTTLAKSAGKKLGTQKAIFVTDEYGRLKKVENYKEIIKHYKSLADEMVEDMYAMNPGLSKMINKATMKKELLSKGETESDVMAMYDEMYILFCIHGQALSMGDTTTVSGNQKTYAYSGEDQPDNHGTEGDYVIYLQTDLSISANEVKNLIDKKMFLFDGTMGKEIGEAWQKNSINTPSMDITHKQIFRYWSNGWLKESTITQFLKLSNEKEARPIEVQTIEWTSRVF